MALHLPLTIKLAKDNGIDPALILQAAERLTERQSKRAARLDAKLEQACPLLLLIDKFGTSSFGGSIFDSLLLQI